MKVRRLWITNFRGIQSLDWTINEDFVCLVGPGDSGKSSILDALGIVFARTYSPHLTDADFLNCDPNNQIVIKTLVLDIPDELTAERSFGRYLCGFDQDTGRITEPGIGTSIGPGLLVRADVNSTLEPSWFVEAFDGHDEREISAGDRRRLGFFRLAEQTDTHLRWSRPSALTARSEGRQTAQAIVLDAHREAREAVFAAIPQELSEIVDSVEQQARSIGASISQPLRAGLEPYGLTSGSTLSIHEHQVPLTSAGLGTKRLTSIAIQEGVANGKSILAIDEVEAGLEPHRLTSLLRHLKSRADEGGQTIFTTHSPIAIEAVSASQVHVVRASGQVVEVRQVPGDVDIIQGTLRSAPSALLAPFILVGEGATEVGFLKALLVHAAVQPARFGIEKDIEQKIGVVDGAGQNAPDRAIALRSLGYPTGIVLDADRADEPFFNAIAALRASDVIVIQCEQGLCFEETFVHSLSPGLLPAFIELLRVHTDEGRILDATNTRLPAGSARVHSLDPDSWDSFETVRTALAAACAGRKISGEAVDASKAWLKRESGGQEFAGFLNKHWDQLATTPIGNLATQILVWGSEVADA